MADQNNLRDEMLTAVAYVRENVSNPSLLTKTAEAIGDYSRVEENRKILTELGVIQVLVDAFNAALPTNDFVLIAFLIRAIGNLCYENKENTIEVTADQQIITDLVKLLKSNPKECGRNIAGTLTNIAWENEANQRKIVADGAIGELAKFFKADTEMTTLFMSLRAVHNLCDTNEENKASINNSDIIDIIFSLLKSTDSSDIQSECIGTINSFLPNEINAKKIVDLSIHDYLLNELITKSDDESVRLSAAELFRELSNSDEMKKISPAFAPKLIKMIQECSEEEVLGCLIRSAAWISENDKNIDLIFQNIDMFVKFCRSEVIDHKISSTMTVGNLARTDAIVSEMMKNGVVELMIELLEYPDGRIQQLALGAIRNLSLQQENKEKIFDLGVMKKMTPILGSLNGNLLFSTIGLIRHFLLLGEKASEQFESSKGLEKIIMFATELEKQEHKRLLFESARVIAIDALFTKDLSPIVKDGLGALVELITSPWALLHEEGAKAIAKIVETEEHRSAFLEKKGAAKGLVDLLTSDQASVLSPVISAISFLVEKEDNKEALVAEGLTAKLSEARERTELPQELKSKIELICMSIVD